MIFTGSTCLKRIDFNVAKFSGFNKVATVPLGSLSKAALFGAKTVKVPSPLSVSASPAAFTAAKRVDRLGVAAAVAAIDFRAVDL